MTKFVFYTSGSSRIISILEVTGSTPDTKTLPSDSEMQELYGADAKVGVVLSTPETASLVNGLLLNVTRLQMVELPSGQTLDGRFYHDVTILLRPSLAHGWPATGAAPVTLGMGTLPASTSVTATNEAGEAVTTSDPADPIILVDPETYVVQIDPAWPYLPETLTIEVT